MKTYKYIIIGVVSFFFFVIAGLPAGTAYGYWKEYLGKSVPVELQDVHGSLWNGKAGQVRIQRVQLQRVQWDFSFFSLLTGKLKLYLDFGLKEGQGKGAIAKSLFGGVSLQDVQAGLYLKDVAPMLGLQSLSPAGVVRLNLQELQIEDGFIVSAEGNAIWQNAEIALFKPLQLGTLEIEVKPDENGIKGVLSDKGGPLEAQGLLNLDTEGKYNLNGSVRVRDPLKTDLNSAINAMGRPGADGKIPLKYSGKMQALPL